MKNLAYLSERQRKELIKVINDEAEAIIEAESEIEVLDSEKDGCNDKDLSPPPSKKSKGEHKLLEFLGDIINPEDQEVTLTAYQKVRIEVKRYQDATVTMEETHEGPLMWWKHNAVRFPVLNKLAMKYLAIPATSVPSERAFSIAGHIVNVKRASLQPPTVSTLVFLSENLQ